MAIFRKSEPQTPKPRERAAPAARYPATDGAISIIGAGMLVVGDIATEGTVRIEGEVRGTIRAGKAVVLGQGGQIDGEIVTQAAVIGGTVVGTIAASEKLELQSSCSVTGLIQTRPEHLKLDEGARFSGQIEMIEAEAPPGDGRLPDRQPQESTGAEDQGNGGARRNAQDLEPADVTAE